MYCLGLHLIDWIILAGYFFVIVGIGKWATAKVHNTTDFYQGGRRLGKVLNTFLWFGNITSADQSSGVAREIYRQGLQGVWFQNLVLFHTPFQWLFTAILQRRARYISNGDIYLHRFESRFLAGLFTFCLIATTVYGGSLGFLLMGKTLQAMMVKPESEYTALERQSVQEFNELQELEKKSGFVTLAPQEKIRLGILQDKAKRGDIQAHVSYLNLPAFYVFYAAIIAAYTIMGGLLAIAITDVIQGVMLAFLSLALIPVGLKALGGFAGLHAKVPPEYFSLFGSDVTSDYTWYYVTAFVTLNLVVNAPRAFTIGGSASDDNAARIGFVAGSFAKRFMMIGWALTGLIALGLYAGRLSDPTNIWGLMTRELLGAGFVGLMIAAIFSANMDQASSTSLEWSAAFIKNVLLPIRPNISEKTQVLIGRLIIILGLAGTVYFSMQVGDIFVVFRYMLSILTTIGPAIWLAFFWRRLTTTAVATQMILSVLVTIVLPNVVPLINNNRENPALTIQTQARTQVIQSKAIEEDVAAGRAQSVGEIITKTKTAPPAGIFYETVVRKNPEDPNSPLVGHGAFRVQVYLISLLGIDFTHMTKPQVLTASFIFDIIFPFLILFGVSLVTKRNSEKVLREFYAAVHTPVIADHAEDARRVQAAIDDPAIVEQDKIFPGTDWEFWKPTRADIYGFILCWVIIGVIIWLYGAIMRIGA
ncbi:MAG: sodium:solute symporter family protein [candidate division KSB1 bacterium]|nr:sodium:solute symporter family protein [candidate division KSB1 bacterium]MDZ7366213.1 sodium:solute symporter family protein [candidate division KSB1 bacterium]MDZ7404431.1 sodium:solute symporter family protein [candidate division KSB1 bacterium]